MSLTPNPPLNPKITRFYVPANSMHRVVVAWAVSYLVAGRSIGPPRGRRS